MVNGERFQSFQDLTFDDFKLRAQNPALSPFEKIGFPDSYRRGKERAIFKDILRKLNITRRAKGLTILDIGPGCSELPHMFISLCEENDHHLILADSQEMLDLLPNSERIQKYAGYFPDDMPDLIEKRKALVDCIICYSALQYVFYKTSIFRFIDCAITLLKPGGKFLIGDIPNSSKRQRFFATESGVKFHQKFTGSKSLPKVHPFDLQPNQIEDGVIFSILQRYRNLGFDTYLLPQPASLPMANRREDVLICKI